MGPRLLEELDQVEGDWLEGRQQVEELDDDPDGSSDDDVVEGVLDLTDEEGLGLTTSGESGAVFGELIAEAPDPKLDEMLSSQGIKICASMLS